LDNINRSAKNEILNMILQSIKNQDITSVMNSSFNPIYMHLCSEKFDMPSYLCSGLPREVINVIAQIRTVGRFKFHISGKGISISVDPTLPCPVCPDLEEDLLHIFTICPLYEFARERYFINMYSLKIDSNKAALRVFHFLKTVSKIRTNSL
jgi:hypothetical protein